MQISRSEAISTTVAAVVVVVIVIAVVGGVYFLYQPGTPTSTSSTSSPTTTSTSSTQTYAALTIQAGGSSFVNPVMQVWAVGFNQFTNNAVTVNYAAVGSSAGITGVTKGTYSYAGSDAPHKNQTATGGTLLNIPETLGAVAIFYNIPGVTVSLNLTGSIIAKIYLEQITMWNDASITALNPKVNTSLLAHTIVPVHRSDGSGTTYALTNYFTKVSTDWNASKNGFGTTVNWPASGELGGKGSGGVAALVQQTTYAIGYADSYYAFSNKLSAASIQNKAGHFLAPTLAGITSAASDFSTQLQADPTTSITNAPGAQSYAIATFTYILVWSNQSNQGQGYDMAQFFWWIVNQGQSYGPALYYPQLPASMVTVDEGLIAQMNYNGVSFIHG